MKPVLLVFCLMFFSVVSSAQETAELNMKLTKDITATYHVLKSDMTTMDGLYQVKFGKKSMALASGLYSKGKKIGIWHFFDYQGKLVENFNYTTNQLLYEAPDVRGVTGFKYTVDHNLAKEDSTSKPVKVGGRYYGYLPLLTVFRMPKGIDFYGDGMSVRNLGATITLLVSPGGRLADYTVKISDMNDDKTFSINLDLIKDEDKIFIPATINGEAVACSIVIPCLLSSKGELTIL